jgi:branched-chain amino acid transport system ATP-binding protein
MSTHSTDGTDDSATEKTDSASGTDRSATATTEYGPDDGVLVVENLRKEFGGLTAVDDLSFAVERGEILGFIGPNGAGKSTTFNCVTGTYPPTAGTVWYRGEDVTDEAPYEMVKRGMSRTFQSFRPLEDRSVLNNVALSMMDDTLFTTEGLWDQVAPEAVDVCERVGLDDQLHLTPDELPHAGMLRLELARALATEPELLLVDEPFAGLSGPEVESVSNLLLELRDEGMTLVVVDHNMRGLLTLIDRAIVINFGAKLTAGTPAEIKRDPDVQEAYLGGGFE